MALIPGTRLGPYEVIAQIGVGGMGEVYRATDTNLKRQVAIKVLAAAVANDADRLARFQREAEVLAALNHPNIAHIHGLEKADGTFALVMELVEGPTLADRIATGAIPCDEALPIAKQIADALDAAHEQGIIHRDLKPANIKVRPDGTVKVLDFGLAKAMAPTGALSANATMSPTVSIPATQAGIILGTVAYMSPEQARGSALDGRVDLWAFGVVLYEMLTGRRPFEGATISDTLAAVLRAEPDWGKVPADTPVAIRRVLRRCLEKDPRRRARDAGDVRLEIDDALTAPRADLSPTEAVPTTRRRIVPFVIASGLGGALVAAITMWGLMRPAPAPPMRFNVDLGPDAVAGRQTTVAISRDGRRIVYQIRGANGTLQLATRLLAQKTPTPLAGTENGADPFFNPDGQWIAFAAAGKLRKISVVEGSAIDLCPVTNLRGGSWGDDGTIVAALNSVEGLSRIPETGGAPQPLTKLTNGEVSHRWPQILPGGQAVLFTASKNRGEWEDATVQVLSVNTGQVTKVADGYFGRYMAGQLTYFHQGVLYGVAFDPATMVPRGTPVPLLDDVASDPLTAAGQLDVSQTGTVVYRSGATHGYPVVLLDSTGKTQPLVPTPGSYQALSVSPNGQRLAYGLNTGKGLNIYRYDMASRQEKQLTYDGRGNTTPVWAPDSEHIVYASAADKTIWWGRADGTGRFQRLWSSTNLLIPTSISFDGRYLAYTESIPISGNKIWILQLDLSNPDHPGVGKPEPFTNSSSSEAEGRFSPDGHWMAYLSNSTGKTEAYVGQVHGSGLSRISTTTGGNYSFWSKEKGTIYYLALDNLIMAVHYTVTGDEFNNGPPSVWSETHVRAVPPGLRPLALVLEGPFAGRFAILPADAEFEEKGLVRATVLLNFFDELHRRLP